MASVFPTLVANQHEEQKVVTVEMKRQIFKHNPKVKSLYDQLVPAKMSEEQFWVKYYQSLYFKKQNDTPTTLSTQDTDLFRDASDQQDKEMSRKKKKKNED